MRIRRKLRFGTSWKSACFALALSVGLTGCMRAVLVRGGDSSGGITANFGWMAGIWILAWPLAKRSRSTAGIVGVGNLLWGIGQISYLEKIFDILPTLSRYRDGGLFGLLLFASAVTFVLHFVIAYAALKLLLEDSRSSDLPK